MVSGVSHAPEEYYSADDVKCDLLALEEVAKEFIWHQAGHRICIGSIMVTVNVAAVVQASVGAGSTKWQARPAERAVRYRW
jgi:hypothetical protein